MSDLLTNIRLQHLKCIIHTKQHYKHELSANAEFFTIENNVQCVWQEVGEI